MSWFNDKEVKVLKSENEALKAELAKKNEKVEALKSKNEALKEELTRKDLELAKKKEEVESLKAELAKKKEEEESGWVRGSMMEICGAILRGEVLK